MARILFCLALAALLAVVLAKPQKKGDFNAARDYDSDYEYESVRDLAREHMIVPPHAHTPSCIPLTDFIRQRCHGPVHPPFPWLAPVPGSQKDTVCELLEVTRQIACAESQRIN